MPVNGTRSGVVKWFDDAKRYGFIIPDDGRPELFFHIEQLVNATAPVKGNRVQFELGRSRNGKPRGENVRVVAPGA